jgi:hypothetical protein
MFHRLSSYWQVSLDLGFCVSPSLVDTPDLVSNKMRARASEAELEAVVQGVRRILERRGGDGKRFAGAGRQECSACGMKSAGEAFARGASASSVMTKLAEYPRLRNLGRSARSRQTASIARLGACIPGRIEEGGSSGSIIASAIRSRGS